jgi:hypothetical protein
MTCMTPKQKASPQAGSNRYKTEILITMTLERFGHRFQATGADVLADLPAAFEDERTLNVGLELPLRFLLRKADVLPKLRSLATDLTFSHNFTSSRQANGDPPGRRTIDYYSWIW